MSAVVHRAEPVGGPIMTRGFRVLTAVFLVGAAAIVYRFASGLGAATALNDGYPWGLWIAFDVVSGTALACGGYAVALLVYILNKGQYHPLVRPALLTSALGYSMAAISITFDVGRPWLLYRVPLWAKHWNTDSALFEVALCVMAYVAVLWIEVSPAFLEKWKAGPDGAWKRLSERAYPVLQKALPWVIALGILLPTMHQSSLGTVMLLPGRKLHALWSTPILPLLFLVSCLGMGYAAVVFESTLSSVVFKRPRETKMLSALGQVMAYVLLGFAVLRFADILIRGRLGLLFQGFHGLLFWVETALFLAPLATLLSPAWRADAGRLFRAAMVMMVAGTLYRFDTYIVAFNPGPQYSYFPSVTELLMTFGVVALEVMAYVFIVKRFPILSGKPAAHAA